MKTKKHRHGSLPETWHSSDENMDKCLPKIKHTPTPWQVIKESQRHDYFGSLYIKAGKTVIANLVFQLDDSEKANAEFIVRAVNSHEALLEAARCAGDALVDGQHKDIAINLLRQAIAQAEGGTV